MSFKSEVKSRGSDR